MSSNPEAYRSQVATATAALRPLVAEGTRAGLILGTGLGRLADEIDAAQSIEYDDIPHFPVSTVESHRGRLIAGRIAGVPVVALQGRFHLYEGYTPQEMTLPIRALALLGIDTLLISNAAGGLNPDYRRGDLMLVSDHINLQGSNPLIGPNVEEWGPRFPDMSEPYDPVLRDSARGAAGAAGITLHEGVYVAVPGPNLETPAEYRFLRRIGGDAVGMSTVPEVIVARHMGVRCMAISVITDECDPDNLEPVSIEDVVAAAGAAEPALTAVMKGVVAGRG
jgi:purine-nucleoside phosphorylase